MASLPDKGPILLKGGGVLEIAAGVTSGPQQIP